MRETDKDFRESVFIGLPKIIDNTLSLTDLEKVNTLISQGFRLISVKQTKHSTGAIGLDFFLIKDKPLEHSQRIYSF